MKRFFSVVLFTVCCLAFSHAQILNPVKWSWKAVETAKGEYKLIFSSTIDPKWHTYSQYIAEGGPVPTKFTFDEKNKDVQLIGKTTERGGKVHDEHDPVFDMQLKYFEDAMICEQKVKVLKDTKLKGNFEFMVCDDARCLPPDYIEFEFDLKAGGSRDKKDTAKTQGTLIDPVTQQFDSIVQAAIDTAMQNAGAAAAVTSGKRFGSPLSECGEVEKENKSLWSIILLGFLGGLAALVTPCVFPMIPLTVSFFTKRSESKTKGKFEALFYGFSIVFIYFLLAVPFLLFDISPDTLNEISTGAPLNVFFFLIFVAFAFSFFGFYEIQLPSFIANKADSASNVGGLLGIFFMAVTLAIVSFSCTGPIIGSLLVGALTSTGGKLNLVAGMTSFGLALALPFAVFALFPGLMKSLPKSGGWLNSVKVVLGFVELIFAVKFLSNADLVSHWGILKREVFLGLWVAMGAGMFAYLVGWLKFPHDSPVQKLSFTRIAAAALALMFTIYTAYGIPGNDLSLFSGFPPPKFYSIKHQKTECPNNINCFHNDYEGGLAYAKANNKPVIVDFTGWACVNCRKMEENVWTDPAIYKMLNDDYVLVSLYVDDKEMLPDTAQYISDFTGKKVRTVGNRFSEFEAKYFNENTQPLYVLLSPDEQLLNKPRPYTPDVKEYGAWLQCGLDAFRKNVKQP